MPAREYVYDFAVGADSALPFSVVLNMFCGAPSRRTLQLLFISSARNRRWRRVCADSVYRAIPAAWAANRGAFAEHATP